MGEERANDRGSSADVATVRLSRAGQEQVMIGVIGIGNGPWTISLDTMGLMTIWCY